MYSVCFFLRVLGVTHFFAGTAFPPWGGFHTLCHPVAKVRRKRKRAGKPSAFFRQTGKNAHGAGADMPLRGGGKPARDVNPVYTGCKKICVRCRFRLHAVQDSPALSGEAAPPAGKKDAPGTPGPRGRPPRAARLAGERKAARGRGPHGRHVKAAWRATSCACGPLIFS